MTNRPAIYSKPKIRYTITDILILSSPNLIDNANSTKIIPERSSNKKYVGLIFLLQYLHFPFNPI